jgi:hypothetical protein
MKVQTSNLIGAQLDWAVAQCDGGKALTPYAHGFLTSNGYPFRPSTDWSQGGPILEGINVSQTLISSGIGDSVFDTLVWSAQTGSGGYYEGETPLIAAMRGYVASKLGDEVEIPDGLL